MTEKDRFSIEFGQRSHRGGVNRSGKSSKKVIVMGDFSGRACSEDAPAQTGYRLLQVAQETLDTLCEHIGPTLRLHTGPKSQPLTINFRCLEDFHPDSICTQHHLVEPVSADAADKGQRRQDTQPPTAPAESEQDTVERLLGKRSLDIERQRAGKGGISSARQALIQDLVQRLAGQSDTPGSTAPADTLIDAVSATARLRTLLRTPGFQVLEATWRSLDWLLRTAEVTENTVFYILDITRYSLFEQIGKGERVEDSKLYRALREQLAGDFGERSDPLWIGDFYFGIGPEDIQLLDGLGQLVSSLGGKLVAAAESDTFEPPPDPARASIWQQFRRTPVSRHLLLCLPRILLRLPYGKTTDPIDSFAFEEMEGHEPDRLLWGNPAFACAIVMLQRAQGGSAETASAIAEMPAYSYRASGESHLQPATEKLYSERQIDRFLDLGLIPVLGSNRRNIIRIPWLQSLATVDLAE